MEVHSNPPASQSETSLLAMVENWSPSEVEEKASSLLENAKKILAKAGSSHEAKLDCICLMAGKLVGFVPIFELEDSLLCPLLWAVVEYLEEVLSIMMETEEENRLVFFSLVCTLVEQTEKVVRHCMEQECGVGEVPSLPRVLPKILITTFSYLGKGEIIATTDLLKAQVANCFSKVRDLLIMFLTLMEKIKMRTVLEDELDILVSLCFELVNFHDVLIPLDFKLTCMVWRVYVKLTSTHQARLVDRLNFTMATEVISHELYVQMVKLRQMLENSLDEGAGKVMAKVMYMLKLLISLGSSPSCVGDSPFFLSLLLEMMSVLPPLPPWLPEAHRLKLEQEVMSVSVMHSLLTMAGNQSFITFILNFSSPDHSVKQVLLAKPILSLQLVVQLLLQQPGQEDQLLLLCFLLLSSSSSCLEKRGCLEGRQVMGKAMTMVDKYTWVLTNLCSWVSTISQTQFYKVEKVLISVLLDSSSSTLTCMMVSDIWCFLARYGTSQLCLAHLDLLSSILQKLKLTTFSTPILFITILMERLTNFLSPIDQAIWQSRETKPDLDQMAALSSAEAVSCLLLATRTDEDKLAGVVRDIWRKLVEGSYKPADGLISSRLMMALCKATLVVVDTFSTKDLVSLVENMKTVVMMGQYMQYLLVCLVKVVRVVACRQDMQASELLAEVVINNVIRRSVGRQGEGSVGVLAIMAMGDVADLGDMMERWRVGHGEEVDIDQVLGGVWPAEYQDKMVKMVNCVQEEEEDDLMRKVSPTPSGGLSPSFKKRKFSPTKKYLEVCLDNLEREVDILTNIVEEDEVKVKKERLNRISSRLQQVLLRL